MVRMVIVLRMLVGAQPGKETSARKFLFSRNKNREQNGRSLMQKVPYLEKCGFVTRGMTTNDAIIKVDTEG